MKKISSIEEYIQDHPKFIDSLNYLRLLLLKAGLKETIKWNAPVYMIEGKNVIGLGAFKHHFCLWFFNGVLLSDTHSLLHNAQEGKTKALRQLRFTNKNEINNAIILEYIKEAITNQELGKEVKPTKTKLKVIIVPIKLQTAFNNNSALHSSFKLLSLSKQREYCNYITEAKREATKLSRIEKITPMIIENKGLHDKYKNC
ncbi:DUF1801 domain-containing protein [Olleya sp. Ti.3.14]|uniref:YdeI/OmpD-associated family protein n=1 Tax=Olleya sp. Ti.3.14 TaxID=3121297 RepID=UPI00311F23D8